MVANSFHTHVFIEPVSFPDTDHLLQIVAGISNCLKVDTIKVTKNSFNLNHIKNKLIIQE